MLLRIENLVTEVPDDLKDKGLDGLPVEFLVVRHGAAGETSTVAKFTLASLPGCCGVVVSINSWINPENRRDYHIGEKFHELKAKTAKYFGYSTMLMTTQLRNMPQVVGASKAQWKFIHYFRNSRTTNDIGLAVKDI